MQTVKVRKNSHPALFSVEHYSVFTLIQCRPLQVNLSKKEDCQYPLQEYKNYNREMYAFMNTGRLAPDAESAVFTGGSDFQGSISNYNGDSSTPRVPHAGRYG